MKTVESWILVFRIHERLRREKGGAHVLEGEVPAARQSRASGESGAAGK